MNGDEAEPTAGSPLTVELRLVVQGEPGDLRIEGTAVTERNQASFDGWIGLLTALEDAALLALNGEPQGQFS